MKKTKPRKPKTVTLSVGNITNAGAKILKQVIKTADEVKRSKLTIKLEQE